MQRGKVMLMAVLALASCVVAQPPPSMGVPIELVRHLYPLSASCARACTCVGVQLGSCPVALPQADRCCLCDDRTHVTPLTSKKSSASSTGASSM